MPIIGPGFDDPEYDNYDPAWASQDTPFRQWLAARFQQTGDSPVQAARNASLWAPTNRYHGLDDLDIATIGTLAHATPDEVRAAHKADLAAWASEQQLLEHPDLAVLNADLDRTTHRY